MAATGFSTSNLTDDTEIRKECPEIELYLAGAETSLTNARAKAFDYVQRRCIDDGGCGGKFIEYLAQIYDKTQLKIFEVYAVLFIFARGRVQSAGDFYDALATRYQKIFDAEWATLNLQWDYTVTVTEPTNVTARSGARIALRG